MFDRFTNILLIGKKHSYISTDCLDILHQIGLKIDECTLSHYIRDQTDFDEFIKHGSSFAIDILESSFSMAEKIKFPTED